jgi:hypothetical protein
VTPATTTSTAKPASTPSMAGLRSGGRFDWASATSEPRRRSRSESNC